jgi:hypothetical protein
VRLVVRRGLPRGVHHANVEVVVRHVGGLLAQNWALLIVQDLPGGVLGHGSRCAPPGGLSLQKTAVGCSIVTPLCNCYPPRRPEPLGREKDRSAAVRGYWAHPLNISCTLSCGGHAEGLALGSSASTNGTRAVARNGLGVG